MGIVERLLRRQGVPKAAGRRVASGSAGATTFQGVAEDSSPAITPTPQGAGLYEFWTESGKHVWLHDMDFRGFAYAAAPTPKLRITFDWGDTPVPESYAGPTVEFIFEDVRIIEWDDELSDDEDRRHSGQVAAFDYSNGVFTLTTFTLSLTFSAVACRVESIPA